MGLTVTTDLKIPTGSGILLFLDSDVEAYSSGLQLASLPAKDIILPVFFATIAARLFSLVLPEHQSAEHGRTRRDLARAAQSFRREPRASRSLGRVFPPKMYENT